MRFLFVGGQKDGEYINVEASLEGSKWVPPQYVTIAERLLHDYTIGKMAEPTKMEMITCNYRRERIGYGDRTMFIFVHPDIKSEDVVVTYEESMNKRYQAPKLLN